MGGEGVINVAGRILYYGFQRGNIVWLVERVDRRGARAGQNDYPRTRADRGDAVEPDLDPAGAPLPSKTSGPEPPYSVSAPVVPVVSIAISWARVRVDPLAN